MKYFTCLMFFVFMQGAIFAQTTGPFVPFALENATPLWNHTSKDTSMVNYEDSISILRNYSYDGLSHLILQNQDNIFPLVENEELYLIMTSLINGDIGGGYIEKINLNNGDVMWNVSFDVRSTENRDYPKAAEIIGDKLIVFSYRIPLEYHPIIPTPHLILGQISSTLVRREYDKNTGELLSEFVSDESNPANQIFRSKDRYLKYDVENNKLKYYHHKSFPENFVEKITTDTEGNFLSTDTIRGAISNLDWTEAYTGKSDGGKLMEHNEYFYILDTYIPDSFDLKTEQAAITKYDKNDNIIFSKTIPKTDLTEFGQLYINSITDEFIILKGYYNQLTSYDPFFLILDQKGEVLRKIDAKLNGRILAANIIACPPITHDQKLFFLLYGYDANSQKGFFDVFQPDDTDSLRLIKKVFIESENYVVVPKVARYLKNGDILLYLTHRFYDAQRDKFEGNFSNWMRLEPEELGLETVSTKEVLRTNALKIYPNPAKDWIVISKNENAIDLKTLYLFDVSGRLVLKKPFEANELQLDISQLKKGTYFCSLTNQFSENSFVSKFIKSK